MTKKYKLIPESESPKIKTRQLTAVFKLTKKDVAKALKQDLVLVNGIYYYTPKNQLINSHSNDLFNLTLTEVTPEELKKIQSKKSE